MDEPSPSAKPFELTPERRDTSVRIRQLLGRQIAERYEDFCRLAAGECSLRIASPMAGHALRELEAIVRQTFLPPQAPDAETLAKVAEAEKQLQTLGFDKRKVDAALDKLKAGLTHIQQIEAIVTRLGLAPDGDVAQAWKKLTGAHGKAHSRAFYASLAVDDQFRAEWQAPMDIVMRELMIALQGKYTYFTSRIEQLVAEKDCGKAAKSFTREIPGALPLLWHFFQCLQSPYWLPHLARLNLLAAPVAALEETETDDLPLGAWPASHYLKRMAESKDAKVRREVADALRAAQASTHPHVLRSAMDILATLPADDAAGLVDLAETWLQTGDRFMVMGDGPHRLIRNLAEAKHVDAALRVMGVLFAVFEENGRLATRFTSHMYEHWLPHAVKAAAPVAGARTLALLCDLLDRALHIGRRVTDDPPSDFTHHVSVEISEHGIKNDVLESLVGEVVDAAKLALAAVPSSMSALIKTIRSHSPKIFSRIALHVLALNPGASAPDAQALLTDRELLGGDWCRAEYAELALAWYPSLHSDVQDEILSFVGELPDQRRAGWKQRFEAHENREPTADEETNFNRAVLRSVLWRWRSALPPNQRQFIESLGDPDAWRDQLFAEPTRPTTTPNLASAPMHDILLFLQTWRPAATNTRETISALAQDLRIAAAEHSLRYSSGTAAFADLFPVYPRNILEGLGNAAGNNRDIDWDGAFTLIHAVLDRDIDPAPSGIAGDDPDWSWCRKSAVELLGHGLRLGAGGIPFVHVDAVMKLVAKSNARAPQAPETEDFEERYAEFPHYGARSTARGAALELVFLMIFWLSKDPESQVGRAPREALVQLPEIARLLEAQLQDRSANGRVPRAIIGKYITWLDYFAESWLRENFRALFPDDDVALRDASWLSHLSTDRGPIYDLGPSLHSCFVAEIEKLGQKDRARDAQHVDQRLVEYLLLFYIAEALPDEVFELFWRKAPVEALQHAMWFLAVQLEMPPDRMPPERRARAVTYWDRRLAAAKVAPNPDSFRDEIGSIGRFFFRKGIDGQWLMTQVLAMTLAGFVPTDPYSLLDRLEKLSNETPERAAEVLAALVKSPHFDRWAYLSQKKALRTIMQNGLAARAPETEMLIRETINYLTTFGDTAYLDLLPPPSPGA